MKSSQAPTKKSIVKPVADERKPIPIAKSLHEKLKFVAAAQNMRLMDLLDSMAAREIREWEKMHGISIRELFTKAAITRAE